MEHPDPAKHDSAAGLARFPAVTLFVERARSRTPEFALTDTNAAHVAALCAHLGGLPLGLELAASLAGVFSPDAILSRLKNTATMSGATGRRDAPPRHATLQATIEWSYRLLTVEQRGLFASISVFVGGFTFAAAESALERPTASLFEDLQALLDQGLIFRSPRKAGEPRFEMLEPIRQYALERLEESDSLADALTRHASYFARFTDSAAIGVAEHRPRSVGRRARRRTGKPASLCFSGANRSATSNWGCGSPPWAATGVCATLAGS